MNKLIRTIDAVLIRPTMYTPTGTYGEVVSFLTGYFSGIAIDAAGAETAAYWIEFKDYVAKTVNEPTSDAFKCFGKIHQGRALDELRLAYAAFSKQSS